MAEYRTDLSRSIAGVGKPDSPLGALKKTGLVGANPAAVEPMFNGSAIMEALGYNDPNGKVDIGVAGGSAGNRAPAIAGGAPPSPAPVQPSAIPAATQPVQAIASPAPTNTKDRFVTATGGASLVSTPKAIAGVQSFSYNKKQPVGGVVANNSASDWSPTSRNAQAVEGIAGMNVKPSSFTSYSTQAQTDEFGRALPDKTIVKDLGTLSNRGDLGRTYDEQVAHAQQVNAANALPTLSPKQAAELAIANDPRRSRVTRANAAQGVAQFNNQMENAKTLLGNQQAQTIAGIKEKGDKYTSDQHLAGVKYNADAHTKAAELAGGAAVLKAQQEAKIKAGDQKQKDTTALQSKVYDQTINGYDFTGIAPTTKHEYATIMAKTAGKGYVTITDPTGTHGDAIVHPGVAAFANQHLKSIKNPDQYVRLLQELDKVAAGGVHRTGIKSTQQLKPLKVSPNQIAGMTTEQG